MPSQHAIELFALFNFAIVGLSLVLQPRAWMQFLRWMQREGEAGVVIYGLLCLLWGTLIVSFHPSWHGLLVVLPAFGALQMLEGLAFLLAPAFGLRVLAVFTEERLGFLRLLGMIALVLGTLILFSLTAMAAT